MINSKQKWLRTASTRISNNFRLLSSVPAAIGGMALTAMLVFAAQVGNAQGLQRGTTINAGAMSSHMGTETTSMPGITGANSVCNGSTTTLSNTIAGGTWTSNNTAVATVGATTGIVTGVATGVATITYTAGSYYTYMNITVVGSIYGGNLTPCVGNATSFFDTTTAGTWSTSNTALATVTPTGVVTGVAAGTVTLSYTRPGCAVLATLTITTNPLPNITGTMAVCVGGTTALNDATSGGTWSSANTSLATVNSATGVATGVAAGSVTVTYSDLGCYKTAALAVNATLPAAITGTAAVCTGNLTTLSDATTGGTWTISNSALATVNTHGVVSGLAAGTDTVYYTKTGCSAMVPVTISTNTMSAITGTSITCVGGTASLSDLSASGTWSSSNIALATVDPVLGVVTGVAVGTPTITYSLSGCYKTQSVTVNNTAPAAISGTGAVCTGSTSVLTDATLGGVWSSSNPAQATVNAYGVVTGVAAGTPNISYTYAGCATVLPFTVSTTPAAITGTMSTCTGATTALSTTATGGTWGTSNASVATVVGGTVTGVAAGTATISYTVGTCSSTALVSVNAAPAITGGNTVCLSPFTYLYLTEPGLGGTWLSKHTTIATVSSDGVTTPVATGTDSIVYTQGGTGCKAYLVITVNPAVGAITGATTLCAGSTTTLADTTASGTWASNNTAVATVAGGIVTGVANGSTEITFTSSYGCTAVRSVLVNTINPIVGRANVCTGYALDTLTDATPGGEWTASNGYVHVLAGGVIQGMIAPSFPSSGTVYDSLTVISYTVGGCVATKTISITPSSVGSVTAPTYDVCLSSTATFTDGATNAHVPAFTGAWSLSNNSVGSINSSGVFTPSALGTTVITYTNTSDGCFKVTGSVVAVSAGAGAITGSYSTCNGTPVTLSNLTTGGAWSTSDSHIATISSGGVVTPVAAGTITVTYSMTGGCETYMPFTVNLMPGGILGYGYGASINYFGLGGTGCTNILGGAMLYDSTHGGTWTSSAPAIAAIDPVLGTMTGGTAGSATITYTIGSCYTTQAVTVNGTNPAAIGGSTNVCLGNTTVLTDGTAGGKWYDALPYEDHATVSSGTVTGVSVGTTTITYLVNGCYTTQTMNVITNPVPTISGSSYVCMGSTDQLTDGLAGGTWSSGSTSIASVNAVTGLVTGIATGYPIIKYSDPVSGCFQLFEMTVANTPTAAVTGTAAACVGSSTTLADVTAGGTWTSSNTAIATVTSTGIVTGVGAGSATINYMLNGCGSATPATYVVTGVPNAITGTLSICGTGTTTLSSTTPGGTWSSVTPANATVDAFGDVTGVIQGTSVISYTLSGCAATATVSVNVTPVAITGTATACEGNNFTLAESKSYGTWSSSNPTIATVNTTTSGTILAASAGVATISYTNYCGTATYPVTVNFVAPIGGTASVCTAAVTVFTDATGGGTWASGTPAVATVDGSGNVTGVSAGSALISYTVGSCTSTQSVFVSNCTRTGNGSTSVEDNAGVQTYTLYPNPSNGNITITQGITDDVTMDVKVINYVGATVYTGRLPFSNGKATMNIDAVNSGMYLVQIADNKGGVQSFKMIIEK